MPKALRPILVFQVVQVTLASLNATSLRRLQDEAWGDQGHCTANFNLQDIKADPTHNDPKKWVDAHNYYRACHGVPGLAWGPELLPYAQAWVQKLLQHCASGADLEAWVNAQPGSGRPHDPNLFTTERPQQAENLDARQWNSIDDPPAYSVEDWYREVQSCPGSGSEPGCGGVLNHYTALIWRDARRVACWVGLRGDLRIVSCRYAAAAGGTGEGCEVPNTVGPPNSGGCQLGDGNDGKPEVPALVKQCPPMLPKPTAGAKQAAPPAVPAAPPAAPPASGGPSCVDHMCMLSCIQKGQLGKCERCLHSEQCSNGFYCCPFMKKCVKDGAMQCMTPIAFCQPPCMDNEPIEQCSCNPKLSDDKFPWGWQKPTCKAGEQQQVVTTTPKPTSPPSKMVFSGLKDLAQWKRLSEFVRSKLVEWQVSRLCASIDATTPSPQQQDVFLTAKATFAVTFSDMSSLTPATSEFEGITPVIRPTSQAKFDQICSAGGAQRLWSVDNSQNSHISAELPKAMDYAGKVLMVGLLSALMLLALVWRRPQREPWHKSENRFALPYAFHALGTVSLESA